MPNTHNHFTLDHILPKGTYNFFSLCFYNLIPSCYSCNSKFKKDIEFKIDKNLKHVSPTSADFSLPEDFSFKVLFPKDFNNILSEENFIIEKSIIRNPEHIERYLKMFKLMGRYKYHKTEILELIQKRLKYPDSRIEEISLQTQLPPGELRRIIFGDELFNPQKSCKTLVKFKRDIARNIGIRGVI